MRRRTVNNEDAYTTYNNNLTLNPRHFHAFLYNDHDYYLDYLFQDKVYVHIADHYSLSVSPDKRTCQ